MTNPATTSRALESWFAVNIRPMPWRTQPRDPYRSLVSEFMLQQTQVSRVLEKFEPFVERFPSIEDLANADEEAVLGAWSGLGYYRRARMLHACAKAIVEHHDSVIPSEINKLLDLPGIGRYTAGAMASMVFGKREPLVDGNVMRVLQRLHNNPAQQTDPATVKWTWKQATELVEASNEPGALNEAMMELGATICTPKKIGCDQCPLAEQCKSLAAGTTESVPPPKPRAKQRNLFCASVLVVDNEGRTLMEQRPSDGMWGNMWQVPTVERDDRPATPDELGQDAELLESFTHQTTHRLIYFDVYRCSSWDIQEGQSFLTPTQIDSLGISNAQRRILNIGHTIHT